MSDIQKLSEASIPISGDTAARSPDWQAVVWKAAAEAKGWRFDAAYGGYIRDDHRCGPADSFASYPSDLSAEEACFLDGLETLPEAEAFLILHEMERSEPSEPAQVAPAKTEPLTTGQFLRMVMPTMEGYGEDGELLPKFDDD